MRYPKASEYFEKGEQGLLELLEDCKDLIKIIEEHRDAFVKNVYSSPEEFNTVMIQLTGIYEYVVEVFEAAQAFKEIEEDKAYLSIRNESLQKGEKITDTTLKVMAHAKVAAYIKIRNTFEAYTLGTEKAISSCQSKLKRLEKTP